MSDEGVSESVRMLVEPLEAEPLMDLSKWRACSTAGWYDWCSGGTGGTGGTSRLFGV
jgi:hypothetical protein